MQEIPVLLVLSVFLLSCSPNPTSPQARADLEPRKAHLIDCTEDVYRKLQEAQARTYFEIATPAELDAPTLEAVLAVATAWARANCYVPCDFDMCAGVLTHGNKIGIYIRPLDSPELGIYPEAELWLNPSTLEVLDSHRYHTGCVEWTGCVPQAAN